MVVAKTFYDKKKTQLKSITSKNTRGQLHSLNDKPAEIEYYDTGNDQPEVEKYYKNGQLHRDDYPAAIYYYEDGKIAVQEYHKNGELHRDNDPAVIEYYENGRVKKVKYYRNGEKHNDSGPAIIMYKKKNQIIAQKYYEHGKKHRNDGPAILEFITELSDTEYIKEEYYKHGELHRDNNCPAIVMYKPDKNILDKFIWTDTFINGKLKYIEFYKNGKLYRSDGPAKMEFKTVNNQLRIKYDKKRNKKMKI